MDEGSWSEPFPDPDTLCRLGRKGRRPAQALSTDPPGIPEDGDVNRTARTAGWGSTDLTVIRLVHLCVPTPQQHMFLCLQWVDTPFHALLAQRDSGYASPWLPSTHRAHRYLSAYWDQQLPEAAVPSTPSPNPQQPLLVGNYIFKGKIPVSFSLLGAFLLLLLHR